ncbi:MAG: hypothetical protein Q8942_17135 [Bacillota bacterium]|nr:hypothetical protein [Bacillota bacterium]
MKKNIILKIVLIFLILSSMLYGCGDTAEKQNEQVPAANVQKTDEKSNLTKNFVDMAGRKIQIPEKINKVYATSQIGIIALYSLNPDKLAGWGYALSDNDKLFIDKKYYGLPVLGVWSGKNGTGNIEEIIRVHPDVIFSIGTIDDSQKSLCDKIQDQVGIPVIMLDAPLDKLDKMYEALGVLVDEKGRAKELGDYCAKTISDINSLQKTYPRINVLKFTTLKDLKVLKQILKVLSIQKS